MRLLRSQLSDIAIEWAVLDHLWVCGYILILIYPYHKNSSFDLFYTVPVYCFRPNNLQCLVQFGVRTFVLSKVKGCVFSCFL